MQSREIKRELKREAQKIKALKGRARWKYIWDYYKILIIAVCFFIFFIGYIINMLRNSIADHWLYVTFVDTTKDDELGTKSGFWQKYVDYTGYDLSQALVEFNANSYFDYLDGGAAGNKYYQMFVTYIDAGTLDAAVMETDALTAFGATGRFLDLNSDACTEIKEKYGDRFIYVVPNDDYFGTEEIPIGIDITDSILMSEYNIYQEGTTYALGIGAYSQNEEAILKFLDLILEDSENTGEAVTEETATEETVTE